MGIPIVLVASGTASRASDTYHLLENRCRKRFPAHPILWAYSSERVRELALERRGLKLPSPDETLAELVRESHRDAVVQPVHLICGEEFHQVVRSANAADLSAVIGNPLLSGPEDLQSMVDALAPTIGTPTDTAILLVGHGTLHPAGLIYELFHRYLQDRYGNGVQVKVLKGHPGFHGAGHALRESGYHRVELIPLMLVAGAHARKDIDGEKETSVRRQLEQEGLAVNARIQGLLELPAVVEIFCDHIDRALNHHAGPGRKES